LNICGPLASAARVTVRSSKHQQGGIFDTIPQDRVQVAACYDICIAPEDAGRDVLYLHDIEQAQFAPFMVEKKVNVRIRARVPAGGGPEQPKMLNAEAAQFGLVRFQPTNGGIAIHWGIMA
jgi:hypothetical protein